MPTPSKFTAANRHLVLELLRAGASRREAAKMAGLDHSTLVKWIQRGRKAEPGGRWREFYLDVVKAEADPAVRLLRPSPDGPFGGDPRLAWRYLERSEEFAPDPPSLPALIKLTLDPTRRLPDDQEDPSA